MPIFEVFTECDLPVYDSFILNADGLEEADETAMDLMRNKYPEGHNFAVEEIKPVKEPD